MGLRVIIEGFGGQGVKSTGDILVAALFRRGHHVQGMPIYSPLQMGGQVVYSLGIDSDRDRVVPTKDRDVFVMMHRRLFTPEQAATVRPGGLILVNAPEIPGQLVGLGRRVAAADGDTIARRNGLARANVPEISTVMAGAFARATGVVALEALEAAVRGAFPDRLAENLRSLRAGYDIVQVEEPPPPAPAAADPGGTR